MSLGVVFTLSMYISVCTETQFVSEAIQSVLTERKIEYFLKTENYLKIFFYLFFFFLILNFILFLNFT